MEKFVIKLESSESLRDVVFLNKEVLTDISAVKIRKSQINNAKIKGKLSKIVFEDIIGTREVETKIIDSTLSYVSTKMGIDIPKCCIYSIDPVVN